MIGDYYSKKQSGQVLLLTVMLLATAITVVLATSFSSISNTQTTKLEEENQRALAAAEAGLEAVLRRGIIAGSVNLSELNLGGGISGQATVSAEASGEFISPLLQKDEQYTFYLSEPATDAEGVADFSNLQTAYNNQLITICFGANTALELTLVKTDYSVKRFAVNPADSEIIQNGTSASGTITNCPTGETFTNQFDLTDGDVGSNNLLLIIRLINNGEKIGLKGGADFPFQGKTIVSTANTAAGITKKVQLFQSYPQIPAEFFVTSF